MPNSTDGARRRPAPRSATVVRTERLTDSLIRVVVGGAGLTGFAPVHADSYVKVMFLHPDGDYARPIDPDVIRATMPEPFWPRQRTYTVRRWDADAGELTLDFVVHGDTGLAGPWAARARPGDEVLLQGPGGDYSPDPAADFHLFAGDESALPAVAAALEAAPADAVGAAFLEVHGAGDEVALQAPPGITVTWLHRGEEPVGSHLVDAVVRWPLPDGAGQWFVHGEAGVVRDIRRHLRGTLGLPMAQLSISGYWRLGADDEGWRAVKREWNRDIEAAETVPVA